jgi:hypothetical protein
MKYINSQSVGDQGNGDNENETEIEGKKKKGKNGRYEDYFEKRGRLPL